MANLVNMYQALGGWYWGAFLGPRLPIKFVCSFISQHQRFYRAVPNEPNSIQVHVFGDASVDAFSAVAYLRFQFPDGSIQCSFMTVKHPKTRTPSGGHGRAIVGDS